MRARLLLLALALGCDSQTRLLAPGEPAAAVIKNPNAVKKPIHVLGAGSLLYNMSCRAGYTCLADGRWGDAGVFCLQYGTYKATAYDANNREIDNSIVVWSLDRTDLLAIDVNGSVTIHTCPHDDEGRQLPGFTFTIYVNLR